MSLLPCPSCSRHVHAHESTCPFCYAALALQPAAAARTTPRLGRAALFALGTGAAAAFGACANVYGGPPTERMDAAAREEPPKPTDIPAPVYGGPPPMAVDAAPPAPPAPPVVDAGVAPKPVTTGHMMKPAYGGPPPNVK